MNMGDPDAVSDDAASDRSGHGARPALSALAHSMAFLLTTGALLPPSTLGLDDGCMARQDGQGQGIQHAEALFLKRFGNFYLTDVLHPSTTSGSRARLSLHFGPCAVVLRACLERRQAASAERARQQRGVGGGGVDERLERLRLVGVRAAVSSRR
jgi:hypothetical protein